MSKRKELLFFFFFLFKIVIYVEYIQETCKALLFQASNQRENLSWILQCLWEANNSFKWGGEEKTTNSVFYLRVFEGENFKPEHIHLVSGNH